MGELESKFGELLRLERERRGKRLDEIAEALRIPESSLRAIEAGNVDALPTPIYFNLFAKTYAESVGIDYTATTEAIREEFGEQPPVEVKKPRKETPQEKPAAKVPAKGKSRRPEPEPEIPEAAVEEDAAPPVKKRSRGVMFGSAAAAVVLMVGGYFAISTFLPGTRLGRTLSSGEAVAQQNEARYGGYDWAVPNYRPSDSLRLKLSLRGESWATILTDGDTALFQNLVPGRTYQVSAQYRVLMSVAVPRVVDIELNGRLIDVVSPETGRISKVEINQANIDSLFNPAPQTEMPAETTGDSTQTP